jgi:hypothetical protein
VIENGFMKHKIYYLHYATFVVLLTALLACAGCKSNNNNPAAQQTSAAKPSPSPYRRLIKKAGWDIPGLLEAKVTMPPRLISEAGNAKVYSTWLTPQSKSKDAEMSTKVPGLRRKGASPPTLKSYLADGDLKELGITAKSLSVMTIVKYDLDGRPFCYVIKYRSTYAIEALHYYDEDGDKSFELIETGTPSLDFVPRIPGWAQQQQ